MYKQYLTRALKAARAAHIRHGIEKAFNDFREETAIPLFGHTQHPGVEQADAYLSVRLAHGIPLGEEERRREFDEALATICLATGIDAEAILG